MLSHHNAESVGKNFHHSWTTPSTAPESPIALHAPCRPMRFSKHACRHATQPSTSALFDHVWINEDSLTAAFRRFANGQRRHGSRVPGPLEARRRLAKRKNTALANVAASGPLDDIAGLFGKDGRHHLKWADSKTQSESQG